MFSSPNEKHVYFAYKRFIKKNGYCPSLSEMKDMVGLAVPTIRQERSKLVEKNLLKHIPGKRFGTAIGEEEWQR